MNCNVAQYIRQWNVKKIIFADTIFDPKKSNGVFNSEYISNPIDI